MDFLACTFLTGLGATLLTDLWGLARKPLLGIAAPDYRLVGRWFAYMPRGKFRHQSIAAAPPVPGEVVTGWVMHYLSGLAFAAVLVGSQGLAWIEHPTPVPALVVGVGSVMAPFLLMQPGMGAGIAASRTSRPNAARIQSLVTHAVFGFGLYAAGWATRVLYQV